MWDGLTEELVISTNYSLVEQLMKINHSLLLRSGLGMTEFKHYRGKFQNLKYYFFS